jgi:hypothetical protein
MLCQGDLNAYWGPLVEFTFQKLVSGAEGMEIDITLPIMGLDLLKEIICVLLPGYKDSTAQ